MWTWKICNFELYFLFYNFMLYSFFGWIYESTFVSVKNRTLVNRGFLNGPVIPIYGAGATIVYMFLAPIQDRASYVFVGGMLIATILEYITSYVMEKLFHAKWWDYSNMKYNIEGRVCLLASLFWGFLSILMIDVLQPAVSHLIEMIPRHTGEVLGVFLALLFLTDFVVTVIYTVQWDKKLEEMERIRDELTEYLEGTKLYETKEELKIRFEKFSLVAYAEGLKEHFDEYMGKSSELQKAELEENREEMESRIQSFVKKYTSRAEIGSFVENRFIKAFPTMKLSKNETFLKDIKKLKKHKKEK